MNKHTITKNELVEQVLKFYEKNVYRFKENEIPCIERPIVKFAAADDHQFRIWADNKENPLIKPTEGFILSFGEKALAQTVISWILPISEYSKTAIPDKTKNLHGNGFFPASTEKILTITCECLFQNIWNRKTFWR